MSFPTTPNSILVRLKNEANPASWNRSWEEFFDLYHEAVRVSVSKTFTRNNWHYLNEEDLEGVVLRVFQSFNEEVQKGFELDSDRGRLRQFILTLCNRRVVDFIRFHHRSTARFQLSEPEFLADASVERDLERFDEEVSSAYHKAELGELLSILRERIAPRNYMIFELVKLNGEEPEAVAQQMEIKRGVVDNSIYKAMQTLREIHEELESNK